MASYRFTNVRILDATGDAPFDGEVLVEDNRIAAVGRDGKKLSAPAAEVIDGGGATLMPGLLDVHTHMSFNNGYSNPLDTVMIPPEDHTLITMKHARLLLDHGFTSCFGAACAKARIDVAIRNAIEAGDIPGPRFLASSLQLCPTGGFGDERLDHFDNGNHIHVLACDGARGIPPRRPPCLPHRRRRDQDRAVGVQPGLGRPSTGRGHGDDRARDRRGDRGRQAAQPARRRPCAQRRGGQVVRPERGRCDLPRHPR